MENSCLGGYQLLRHQALAEGIAQKGKYALVVSSVAFDAGNGELMGSMACSTGLLDIQRDCGKLFAGRVTFSTFTHQEWVAWVSEHDQTGEWTDWLAYIRNRYVL